MTLLCSASLFSREHWNFGRWKGTEGESGAIASSALAKLGRGSWEGPEAPNLEVPKAWRFNSPGLNPCCAAGLLCGLGLRFLHCQMGVPLPQSRLL